jgi:hypothetical protein
MHPNYLVLLLQTVLALPQTSLPKTIGQECQFTDETKSKSDCEESLDCTKTSRFFFFERYVCTEPVGIKKGESCDLNGPSCKRGLQCSRTKKLGLFDHWICTDKIMQRIKQGKECNLLESNQCEVGLECKVSIGTKSIEIGKCEKPALTKKQGESCDVLRIDSAVGICEEGLVCKKGKNDYVPGTCSGDENYPYPNELALEGFPFYFI